MRTADRPLPPVTLDTHACADWPVRPVIAIAQKTNPAYAWDDAWATWDDPSPLVWDVATTYPDWVDATCDFRGFTLEAGNPDDHSLFDATHLELELDNRSGMWSQYSVDGTPARFGPGQTIAVWAHNTTGDWWLFYGRVATWQELADDTITVEAFGPFSDLAQPVGTLTAGVNGDKPGVRLAAIVTASQQTVRSRFDPGAVTLTAQASDKAPLEEMQTVTASDGGLLYEDADGTLVSTARTWRTARPDQTAFPIVSDNVCTAPLIVWDPVISTTDELLADTVTLENIAALRAVASRASSTRYVIAETGQQWTLQTEGDALAAFLLTQQSAMRLALESAELWLFDPHQPELWRAVDWRLQDRLRFMHDARTPQGTARVDIDTIVTTLRHDVTADRVWVLTFGTSRAIAWYAPALWDGPAVWDDGSSVWGY